MPPKTTTTTAAAAAREPRGYISTQGKRGRSRLVPKNLAKLWLARAEAAAKQ